MAIEINDTDGDQALPYVIDNDIRRDEEITAEEIRNALNALQNLVKHTHHYWDSVEENTNCVANCSRGIL